MRARARSLAPRDQEPSVFASALMRLCDATGGLGAALVDGDGETVDYAATMQPFDMKIAAAEMSILLGLLAASNVPGWADTDEIVLRGGHRTLFVRKLPDGYALVLLLPRRAFSVSHRALEEALRDIAREAGLPWPAREPRDDEETWSRVEVRPSTADPRRPVAIWLGGAWRAVDVLGRLTQGLSRREVGFRARLPTGAELNLVREPLGRWYAGGRMGVLSA